MELTRVKLADLRPSPGNLRSELEGIEELADLLDLTPGAPGEPIVPLIAMRDANVFRIVDGHRRFRAMELRGKVEDCNVLVCDGQEDVERAEKLIMLLSDTGQHLEEGDFARGVQQAMLLGVPERDVDKLARKKGAGRALYTAMARNGGGGAVEQLTVERAIAAQEVLEAGGTDEDYEEVMNGDSYSYNRNMIISRIEAEREEEEREQAIAEIVEKHGLVVTDRKPKGALLRQNVWRPKPEAIRSEWPTLAAAGCTVVRPSDKYGSWGIYDKAQELTPEQEAAVQSRNRLRKVNSAGKRRRAEWVYGRLSQGGGGMAGMHALENLVLDLYDGDDYDIYASEFLKRAGVGKGENCLPLTANAWMCAYRWGSLDGMTNNGCDSVCTGEGFGYHKREAEGFAKLLRALERDGYEPDEAEREMLALCEERLAESHAKD